MRAKVDDVADVVIDRTTSKNSKMKNWQWCTSAAINYYNSILFNNLISVKNITGQWGESGDIDNAAIYFLSVNGLAQTLLETNRWI